MKCTGFELLIDFLDGRLDEEEASRISAHLRSCQTCEANKAWYEQVRAIVESDDRFRPAPWVVRRAGKILEESEIETPAVEAAASLVYDSLQSVTRPGTRSMESAGRELVYEADIYSIDLQIVPFSKLVAGIVGQVLRKDDAGFDSVAGVFVDLTLGRKDVWSTVTNSMGEFVMNEVDYGLYDLRIEVSDMTLRVSGLPVSLIN